MTTNEEVEVVRVHRSALARMKAERDALSKAIGRTEKALAALEGMTVTDWRRREKAEAEP